MKKVAIFVEGQTEHILIDYLLKTWWQYSDISINNIQLSADFNTKQSKLYDHEPPQPKVKFVIIDVTGDGTLVSAIANRSGIRIYDEIFALRDLIGSDKEKFKHLSITEIEKQIRSNFSEALAFRGFDQLVKLHLAIREIEAWLLSFKRALRSWCSEFENFIPDTDSPEMYINPTKNFSQISNKVGFNNSKHFSTIKSFVSNISRDDIEELIKIKTTPRFLNFWNEIVS